MGWVSAMAPCYRCRRIFSFNPDLVPSIRVNFQGQADPDGERQPICQSCVEQVNPIRLANGLEPITILPGAYDPKPEEWL